jgi:integrase
MTMMNKRGHGDGGIDQRGEDVFRLRYRVDGKRHAKTFHGTLTEARKELRKLIRSGDTGEHVAPNKTTVGVDRSMAQGRGTGSQKEESQPANAGTIRAAAQYTRQA